MDVERSKILQGTLDLMVLKTLDAMGPMHGYGIALRIEQVAGNALTVYQGTLYLCLVRLLQRKWLSATWATSENNRRARSYASRPTLVRVGGGGQSDAGPDTLARPGSDRSVPPDR